MSEKPLPFVVTDRRKFTTDGEPRPDADPSPARVREMPPPPPPLPEAAAPGPVDHAGSNATDPIAESTPDAAAPDPNLPPPPTPEQMEQSRIAFEATADRLDVAIRAANPGGDHPPALTFESLVQSVYMQAIMQLGGGTQEGQQPQVDILGARQSIDMIAILNEKTSGNLSAAEKALLESALFELRLAFLEITQALARSAQQRQAAAGPAAVPGRGGPNLVR